MIIASKNEEGKGNWERLMNARVHAEPAPAQDGFGLFIMGENEEYKRVYVTGVVFQTEELKEAPAYHTPSPLTLQFNEAQMLMDSLWRAGLRPSSGEGNSAFMGAKDAHLNDLRQILFFHLGIKKG